MKVLIDNGHGENTPGKRSPDGRLREWAYSREIADRVVFELRKKGIDAERIVKEDSDVPLSERCRRANAIYKDTGKKAILISIHCNAAGSGTSWMNARGGVYLSLIMLQVIARDWLRAWVKLPGRNESLSEEKHQT